MQFLEKEMHKTTNYMLWKFDRFASQYGLTGRQLSTIDFLANQPGKTSTQHAIEREFNIKRSTTTKLLQRMETAGLIERQTSPTDQRSKLVSLTPQAAKLANVASQYIEQRQQKLAAHFSPAELATFEKIIKYLQQEDD